MRSDGALGPRVPKPAGAPRLRLRSNDGSRGLGARRGGPNEAVTVDAWSAGRHPQVGRSTVLAMVLAGLGVVGCAGLVRAGLAAALASDEGPAVWSATADLAVATGAFLAVYLGVAASAWFRAAVVGLAVFCLTTVVAETLLLADGISAYRLGCLCLFVAFVPAVLLSRAVALACAGRLSLRDLAALPAAATPLAVIRPSDAAAGTTRKRGNRPDRVRSQTIRSLMGSAKTSEPDPQPQPVEVAASAPPAPPRPALTARPPEPTLPPLPPVASATPTPIPVTAAVKAEPLPPETATVLPEPVRSAIVGRRAGLESLASPIPPPAGPGRVMPDGRG